MGDIKYDALWLDRYNSKTYDINTNITSSNSYIVDYNDFTTAGNLELGKDGYLYYNLGGNKVRIATAIFPEVTEITSQPEPEVKKLEIFDFPF